MKVERKLTCVFIVQPLGEFRKPSASIIAVKGGHAELVQFIHDLNIVYNSLTYDQPSLQYRGESFPKLPTTRSP